jgi:RNA polymerase subunit RPABC4/transcription elongation factor Spt4
MAMAKCRECKHEISTEAKICPNCGVKKPYRKEWKDMPLWQKIFVVITLGPIILMFIVMYANREDSLNKKVVALNDSQYQEKYEGYLRLHEINGSNPEYAEKAIKYAKIYLKTLPVTEPDANLSVYKALSGLDSSENYSDKINFYTFMRNVSTQCAISSQDMSRNSLNNKSTYNSIIGSGGRWIDKDTYGYVDIFEGANSFGVVSEFTATYSCDVDFKTKKYSVVRVSLGK